MVKTEKDAHNIKMEEFTLTWDEPATEVVQEEEVICGMDDEVQVQNNEFSSQEIIVAQNEGNVESGEIIPQENMIYMQDENVLVMEQGTDGQYMEELVVTENWNDETCPEIVVGSEENVIGEGEVINEDIIPLPTDQDEYTAARPYPCDFCSRRFRKKANLMNHMVAHQSDRPHSCNLCGVRYIRKCDLMNHLKIHAYVPETDNFDEEAVGDDSDFEKRKKPKGSFLKKKKRFKVKEECEDSTYDSESKPSNSRSFANYAEEDIRLMEEAISNEYSQYQSSQNSSEIIRYPITDPKKPFVCQHCGVGFAREKALASHSRIHAGDSPFECQKCGEMFWDVQLIKEHMRNKHGGVDDEIEDDDDEYSEEDSKYGEFFCQTCGISFHRQDLLKRHQRQHIKEEFVNEDFGHICNVCGESFPEALDLLAHAEVHARGLEQRCMICGEVCSTEELLAAHVQAKHGKNLQPNTCLQCGRTCKDRRTLLKHSFEHNKEKMFTCNKCPKTFHNKARLKRHMLSHRNKVVSCDVCGEDFPDGRSLMNHRHSHSSVSGRQFPCRECGKTFGSRSSQQIHIRIHTGERPYGCRFCWKAFADGGTLRKHERIHTGEKPYACAVCPRAFNQRVVLREHIRSHHSGPDPNYTHSMTPYCCTVCSDMFATSQDLIVHLIHHCDLNTAMKRQPQVGPRKYKRRRKLKPHEIEMMSGGNFAEEDADLDDDYTESEDDEVEKRKKISKKKKTASPKNLGQLETFPDVFNTVETVTAESLVGKTPSSSSTAVQGKVSSKKKSREPVILSRPKMIHTQKTKVQVESGDGGKVRLKTKTMVTRTQPTEIKSATGERIRPRTKNVSYHVLHPEKFPLATFPQDDAAQAVNDLLASDSGRLQSNGVDHFDLGPPPEDPLQLDKEEAAPSKMKKEPTQSLTPGRHIIGPGTKVVRIVKGGMIVKNSKKEQQVTEEMQPIEEIHIKQEVVEASPLHELAEISMQHAQNIFKCEMCSEVFSDRAQLLVHVPIHI